MPESIEMVNMARSQQVVIYTKLESFKSAADKVRDQLKTVLKDVEVLLYNDYQKGSDNFPLSVVVVIDARQTRTLITPERGDRNVDHVEELAKLERETSPKGSILIVIYGDEHSSNLSEEEHVAKQWLQSWKFNDTKAYELALKGRCFSIEEKFNKKQEKTLREYFQQVLKTENVRDKASTVVVGEKSKEHVLGEFRNNPFLRELPTDGSENETQYSYFSFASGGKEPTLQIDFETSLWELKVCQSNDFRVALESQLKNLNNTTYGTTRSKKKRRTYDNALLSCHCSECETILKENLDEVTTLIKREAFDVKNIVTPVENEDQDILMACQSVKKSWWEKRNTMQKYCKCIVWSTAVILLLLTAFAVSIIVSLEEVTPSPMTTLTPNTTIITNTTMTSPLTNTTLPTNLTTAETSTSILPTNGSVITLPSNDTTT